MGSFVAKRLDNYCYLSVFLMILIINYLGDRTRKLQLKLVTCGIVLHSVYQTRGLGNRMDNSRTLQPMQCHNEGNLFRKYTKLSACSHGLKHCLMQNFCLFVEKLSQNTNNLLSLQMTTLVIMKLHSFFNCHWVICSPICTNHYKKGRKNEIKSICHG